MGQDTRLNTLDYLTIPDLVKFQADKFLDKPALVSTNETLSFEQLDIFSTNVATHLINLGI